MSELLFDGIVNNPEIPKEYHLHLMETCFGVHMATNYMDKKYSKDEVENRKEAKWYLDWSLHNLKMLREQMQRTKRRERSLQ